eukprot:CAMPEP_0117418350 /NCGR_PEP_ID=MMETSP0758-20121206/151_1 /TAXON_ID=63605 /ORGANISM="Percolomonas cosmopolitus, Strain AE-1 (ATCC 50343)" /LENGTH=863 /DNA_ID=CAMNT_0005198805 /DNA_START=271 /DNA_END=2858 /DNA_ORIENTATION=-
MEIALEEEKQDLEKLNDRLFALSELRKMKDKLDQLKKIRAWLQLEAYQTDVEEKIQFLQEMDDKSESVKQLENALIQKNVKLKESQGEIQSKCDQLKRELNELTAKKQEKTDIIKDLRSKKQHHNVKKQQIERDIKREERYITRILEKITSEEQESQGNDKIVLEKNKAFIKKLELDIKETEQNIEKNRELITQQQHHQDQLRMKYDANAKDYSEIKQDKQHLMQAIDRLRNLEKSEGMFYDKNMNLLLKSKPPIGPMGLLLSVTDRRWACVAEYHLRKHKDIFIVNNQADKKYLDMLIQRYQVKVPSTIVMNIDEKRYQADRFYPNMQRHLFRLSDLMVINQTMLENDMYPITHNIKELEATIQRFLFDYGDSFRIILEEDSMKAMDLMFSRSFQDVKGVYALEGIYHYKRGGKQISLTNTRVAKENSIWSTNREEQLKHVQHQIETAQRDIVELDEKVNGIKVSQNELKKSLQQSEMDIRQTEREYKEHYSKLQDFQFVLREKQNLVENLIENPSQRQIDELKMEHEAHLLKKKQLEDDHELMHQRVSGLEQNIEEEKMHLHNIDPQRLEIEQHLREEARLMEDSNTRIEENRRRIIELKSEMTETKQKLPELKRVISEIEQKMTAYIEEHDLHEDPRSSAEQASSHTIADLDSMISLTERHIEENANANIYEKYEEVKLAFEKQLSRTSTFEGHVHAIKELFEQYRDALSQRSTKFQALKQFIKKNTSHIFNALLEYRHHSGSIDIDPRDQKLTVHVTIGGKRGEKEGTYELSTLSGGERSYSTSALLLSLWVNVDSPLRIVDEIDVYMDDKHRHLTYELIVETVRQHFIPQVILVTPHDPSLFSKWSDIVHFIVLTAAG